jgi:hypothetical protein
VCRLGSAGAVEAANNTEIAAAYLPWWASAAGLRRSRVRLFPEIKPADSLRTECPNNRGQAWRAAIGRARRGSSVRRRPASCRGRLRQSPRPRERACLRRRSARGMCRVGGGDRGHAGAGALRGWPDCCALLLASGTSGRGPGVDGIGRYALWINLVRTLCALCA